MLVVLTKDQRCNHLNLSRETLGAWHIKLCICAKNDAQIFISSGKLYFVREQQQKKSSVNREDYLKKKKKSCESFNQVVFNRGDAFVYFQSRSTELWKSCPAGYVRYLKINCRNQSSIVQDASRARFEPHGQCK